MQTRTKREPLVHFRATTASSEQETSIGKYKCSELISAGGNKPAHCDWIDDEFDADLAHSEYSQIRERLRIALSQASCQVNS
jgi:hypothetical protein